MPQVQQFGTSNIVAEFQGFILDATVITRAAQNCSLVKVPATTGQYQLLLNNVVPDDCNFLPQIDQNIQSAGQQPPTVKVAFPPVGADTSIGTFNYIQFGFYNVGTELPQEPNAGALFSISVFNCNDGLVGLTNPATGLPFRTPGNP